MAAIANLLLDQTEQRFKDQKGPDGAAWALRSAGTLKAYEARAKTTGGQKSWGACCMTPANCAKNIFSTHGADFASVGSPEP